MKRQSFRGTCRQSLTQRLLSGKLHQLSIGRTTRARLHMVCSRVLLLNRKVEFFPKFPIIEVGYGFLQLTLTISLCMSSTAQFAISETPIVRFVGNLLEGTASNAIQQVRFARPRCVRLQVESKLPSSMSNERRFAGSRNGQALSREHREHQAIGTEQVRCEVLA